MKKNIPYAKLLFPFVLLVLIAVVVTSVGAQDELKYKQYLSMQYKIDASRWLGPEGGSVTALATTSSSSTLYAGTWGTGVFKTTNSGTSWTAVNKNMNTLKINALAVNPGSTTVVYAGTEGQGIYKTTDGGTTWKTINTGIKANSLVYAIVVNPGNTELVYAATKTQGTSNGVLYKSTDSGANWSAVLTQTGDWVNSLAVNPNEPNIILAATENHGVYVATSYGSSGDWDSTNISGGDWKSGVGVAFDPRSDNNRAFYASKNNAFYRSTNNGQDWTLQDYGLGNTIVSHNGLAVNPIYPDNLYLAAASSDVAGVIKTDDLGDTWHALGLKGKKVNAIVVSPGNGNILYAGTDQEGVYKSTDGGETWKRSSSGLGSSYVTGVVFPDATTAYAATYGGGVFKSTNTGSTWSPFNNNLTDLYINGLVLHPTQHNILFALTASSGLRRYDLTAGTGWAAPEGIPEFLDKPFIAMRDNPDTAVASAALGANDLAFAPSNPNIAFLATNGGGVYTSSDSGSSFAPKYLINEVVKSVAVHPTNPQIVYAATTINGVVKKSIPNTSAMDSLALPDAQLQKTVNVVAVWPGIADNVSAGTSNGVWFYNGTAFEAAGLQGFNVTCLVADPFRAGIMIAGTDRGVFYSRDHKTWTAVASDQGSLDVASLNFNPAENQTIYIGTAGRGTLKAAYLP